MDFDQILDEIGEFGNYQKFIYYLLCFPIIFCAMNSYSYIFTSAQQKYRCFIPECEITNDIQYQNTWNSIVIPTKFDLTGNLLLESCTRFKFNSSAYNVSDNFTCSANWFTEDIEKCDNWVFDENERTIVKDWQITCPENQWLLALVGTVHFVGYLFGSFWILLGDYFGRKKVFIITTFVMSVSGIGQGLSQNYLFYQIFGFLNAFGNAGMYPLIFVIGLEMVGKRKRHVAGIIINYFYAIGEAFLGLLAWYFRDWVILQLVISVPCLIFVFYYCFIPESVRWLLIKNKTDKAVEIIEKAAKFNKKVLSQNIIDEFREHCTKSDNCDKISISYLEMVKRLISSKIIVKRILLLIYIWSVNALVYNGLSLNSVSLSGNKFLNFILVSLVEIPGYTVTWIIIDRFGRRWSTIFTMVLCGITCILGGYAHVTWLQVLLFLIGKLGITMSFTIIYVHSAEMLPTSMRSSGVGVLATFGRLASIVAPLVPLLANYYEPLPFIVYGILPIIGAFFTLFLPETTDRKLPDTLEDAMKIEFEKEEKVDNKINGDSSLIEEQKF